MTPNLLYKNSFFDPAKWYWIVGGSTTQVFSGAAGDYVPVSNPAYVAWLASGKKPTKIDTEANLGEVLAVHGLKPVAANVLNGYAGSLAGKLTPEVLAKWIFNLENRVRALEVQPPRTQAQVKTYLEGLLKS